VFRYAELTMSAAPDKASSATPSQIVRDNPNSPTAAAYTVIATTIATP
jgi:hypothetical protein